MQSTGDTIVAIATPPGHGGVGIVRLSGPASDGIARIMAGRGRAFSPRRATKVTLRADALSAEALVTYYPGPRSYTGDDVVEFSAHGNPVVLAALVEQASSLGARLAQPGEFTLRAFVNGKLDLVQAEAVADIVDAVSPAQVRAAYDQLDGTLSSALAVVAGEMRELELKLEASMDFPDEGYHFIDRAAVGVSLERVRSMLARLVETGSRGQVVREGARVVIAGTPNAGKSSLFNALAGADRAIVAATPGTTRDLVTARVVLADHAVELVDTAGIRDSTDAVEQEGVRRAGLAVEHADVTIVAIDSSRPISDSDRAVMAAAPLSKSVVVATKTDLAPSWALRECGERVLAVSTLSGVGVDAVVAAVAALLDRGSGARDHVLVTNARHKALLVAALAHIAHAVEEFAAHGGELPEEFVAADVQQALVALDEVTGRRTADDLLREIFARFCIGK